MLREVRDYVNCRGTMKRGGDDADGTRGWNLLMLNAGQASWDTCWSFTPTYTTTPLSQRRIWVGNLACLLCYVRNLSLEFKTAILWKGINWLYFCCCCCCAHTSSYHKDDKSLFIYKQSVQNQKFSWGREGEGMGWILLGCAAFVS